MDESKLVSIIVPAYNVENYIGEAIESVLEQTYKNWELIIIDDGSIDNTADIVKNYQIDKRIFYYYQQNSKQGKARNHALNKSKGEYIAFLDADDLWVSNKLEMQLQVFQEKQVDVVYSQGWILRGNFNKQLKQMNITERNTLTGYFSSIDFVHILFKRNPVPVLSAIVKREKILNVKGFGEEKEIQNAEDFQLWLKLADSGCDFFGMTDRLFYYRIHENQSTYTDIYSSIPTIWSIFRLKLNLVNEDLKNQYMFYMVNKIILRESDKVFKSNFNNYIELYRIPLKRFDMYIFVRFLKLFGQKIFKKIMYRVVGNKNLHF